MLVLTRKTNEQIVIGDNIRITVVEVAPGRVKIGITAPKSVTVDRAEIHEEKMAALRALSPAPVNRLADVLPPQADVPTVVPAPAGLPNRISGVRPLARKKPR